MGEKLPHLKKGHSNNNLQPLQTYTKMDFKILLTIFIGPKFISTERIMHKFDIYLEKAFENPMAFQMKNTGI